MAKQQRPAARGAASRTASRVTRAATPAAVLKIRQSYAKAVALYEKGLTALQRHRFATAATSFRKLLDQYPDEGELHDRARLYLNVCARKARPKAAPPKTRDERILAATLALNRRDVDEVLSLLGDGAATPSTDCHVQYLLALAHAQRNDADTAARHLRRAIELNPETRDLQAAIKSQEPDFDRKFANTGRFATPSSHPRRRLFVPQSVVTPDTAPRAVRKQ